MAAPSLSSRSNPYPVTLSTVVYALLSATLVFLYLRGLLQLLPFRDRILGGTSQLWPRYAAALPVPLPLAVLLITVLVVAVVLLRRPLGSLVAMVPMQLRGLVLPLPVYFVVRGDLVGSIALAVLAVVVWLVGEPMGKALRGSLRSVPRFVWTPLARFWPAILYAALFSRSINATLLAALMLWGIHFLDSGMEAAFRPVWDWLRALPHQQATGVMLGRLFVGFTAPFVLSYSLAWFNPLYDRMTFAYTVITGVFCFFVTRGPSPLPMAPAMARPRGGGAGRAASGLAVLATAFTCGLMLAFGAVEEVHADDCSGDSDCAGTTWFLNALGNSLSSMGASALGFLSNTLFPNGVPPELQSLYQSYQLQNMMQNGYNTAKQQGYYAANYTNLGKVWNGTIGYYITDWFTGSKWGQCGQLVEVSEKLFKDDLQKMFPGAKVDQAVVIEKSTMDSNTSWSNWTDSIADFNHVATRVTMPDGKVYIMDMWEALGSGQPRLMTEQQWVDLWKDRIGKNDFYYDGWNGDTPPPPRPVRTPPLVRGK